MWNQCLCQYRVWRNGQLIRFLGLMGDLWQWFWPVVGEWGCSPRFKLAPKISEKTGRFSYELGKFHPFWAGRAGQNLGEFLVSESPFESFSKFVKTTPGLQSWCFILKQTEKKSQQHFSQFLYFHQFNLTHDHGRRWLPTFFSNLVWIS